MRVINIQKVYDTINFFISREKDCEYMFGYNYGLRVALQIIKDNIKEKKITKITI